MLVQRTILTGWLLLIHSEMEFIRLLSALMISVAFLVAVLVACPYKRKLDLALAASCQVLFVCTFTGALVVWLYESLASDSRALAYHFLGLRSADEAVVLMISFACAILAVLACTLGADVYMHIVYQRLKRNSAARFNPSAPA